MKTRAAQGKLEAATGHLVAHAITLLFFCMSLASFAVPHLGDIKPSFVLMAVYYWAIFRPTLLPPAATFAIGLCLDFLSGQPPGLNAFILIAVQWFVREQRRFLMGQTYVMVWLGFAVVCAAATALHWAAFGLLHLHWSSPYHSAISVLFGIALFPACGGLLLLAHRMLPAAPAGGA